MEVIVFKYKPNSESSTNTSVNTSLLSTVDRKSLLISTVNDIDAITYEKPKRKKRRKKIRHLIPKRDLNKAEQKSRRLADARRARALRKEEHERELAHSASLAEKNEALKFQADSLCQQKKRLIGEITFRLAAQQRLTMFAIPPDAAELYPTLDVPVMAIPELGPGMSNEPSIDAEPDLGVNVDDLGLGLGLDIDLSVIQQLL